MEGYIPGTKREFAANAVHATGLSGFIANRWANGSAETDIMGSHFDDLH